MRRENLKMGSPQSGAGNRPTTIRDMRWSPSEKAVARQAFDRALHREFESVIREAQRLAAEIQQPSDLWELEDYLRERRKDIDSQYDYRYSVLPFVFARLISTGRLSEEELNGLSEEKLVIIRDLASH
jgi:hypothetical protein